MQRLALAYLKSWFQRSNRKPLIVRGARQVGKTFLIRQFGKEFFDNIVEINFENEPDVGAYFDNPDIQKVIRLLEAHYKTKISPQKTLLFLDEIQSAPKVIARLRYFHEQIPELAVVAAGSLLDFVLQNHDFPMPVGRIEYLYLTPMSFEEFLMAGGERGSLDLLRTCRIDEPFPLPLHQKLMEQVKTYCLTGGMPEVVASYIKNKDTEDCDRIKRNLLATYEDDFAKYRKRVSVERLKKVFRKIPKLVGQKIKYVNIDRGEQSRLLAEALQLLSQARVSQYIFSTKANGVPLGAEIDEYVFKMLFIDTGLMATSCGLNLIDFESLRDINQINQGAVSEQFVGQQLQTTIPVYQEPELYYWAREKKGTEAEIDYVMSLGTQIIPIEVKSGKTGSLRSLHYFVAQKKSGIALRFNSDRSSVVSLKSIYDKNHSFTLVSLPFYLVSQWQRLVKSLGISQS